MASLEKRVDHLKRRGQPPGKMILVGLGASDWTAEQLAEAVEAAKAEAGPTGTVICVKYGESMAEGTV